MDNVIAFSRPEQAPDVLSELLRAGAQQLIEQAVEAELQEYLSAIGDRATRMVAVRWCETGICLSARCSPRSGQ